MRAPEREDGSRAGGAGGRRRISSLDTAGRGMNAGEKVRFRGGIAEAATLFFP